MKLMGAILGGSEEPALSGAKGSLPARPPFLGVVGLVAVQRTFSALA